MIDAYGFASSNSDHMLVVMVMFQHGFRICDVFDMEMQIQQTLCSLLLKVDAKHSLVSN